MVAFSSVDEHVKFCFETKTQQEALQNTIKNMSKQLADIVDELNLLRQESNKMRVDLLQEINFLKNQIIILKGDVNSKGEDKPRKRSSSSKKLTSSGYSNLIYQTPTDTTEAVLSTSAPEFFDYMKRSKSGGRKSKETSPRQTFYQGSGAGTTVTDAFK